MAPVHCVAAPFAEYAAQADAQATMMSTPYELMGAAAGRNIMGEEQETFAEEGKAMTRDRCTLALTEVSELQGSVVSDTNATEEDDAVHVPTLEGDAPLADQH